MKARIELLRQRADRDHRERDLRDAIEAATALDRLQRMIADLLDAGRLEQGLFTITPLPVDLVPLIRETAAGMRTPACEIQVRALHEVVASADPERIRQALENLLTNAVQHAPTGTPVVVTLNAAQRDGIRSGSALATIAIHENGPGIPPDFQPRLFDHFQRGPRSTGLGLGLYLAQQIALAHQGTLTVESSPETGTCFLLALPDRD